MTFIKTLTLVLTLIILESCGASQNTSSASDNSNIKNDGSLSGNYTITTLEEKSVALNLSIQFDSETKKVSGFSGCNQFFGNYKVEGNTISFSPLGSTKMFCQDEKNDIETKLMTALGNVNSYEIEGKQLLLKNDNQLLILGSEENEADKNQSKMNVTYEANTRGFYEKIWVKDGQLSFTNQRTAKAVMTNSISKKNRDILLGFMQDIDAKSLPELEAPSKAFQYDGAAIATLKIENEEGIFLTSAFDHGNPPQAIKPLVEKLLSIKEEMAK